MVNKQSLVSIVVPVYNVEQYLEKCVQSILEQSYTNIEVILVNDGSKDNSGKICDELAKDYRVRVYHKENGGVSSARNYGIERARGEYVSFVDSDDVIVKNCIDKLMQAILKNSYDFAGMCKFFNKQQNTVIKICEMRNEMLEYLACDAYSVHAYIYRMDILKEMNIRFREDMTCSEDALFNREYFCRCDTLFLTTDKLYLYNSENESSLSHKGHSNYAVYFVEKLKALNELCVRMKLSEDEKGDYLSYRAIHGLKISLAHYASHWSDKNDLVGCFQKSIKLFAPYITKTWVKDRKLAMWYFLRRPLMQKKKVKLLARLVKSQLETRRFLSKVYKRLKKVLRKTFER